MKSIFVKYCFESLNHRIGNPPDCQTFCRVFAAYNQALSDIDSGKIVPISISVDNQIIWQKDKKTLSDFSNESKYK